MDNLNLNNDMLNKLKNMIGEEQVNDAISKISPEMIQNFSNMMGEKNNTNSSENFGNIDMETLLKIKSILDKLNNKGNDPRSNLLNSLKPYMRESRKENIDKYSKLLKIADLATLLNNETNNDINFMNRNNEENSHYDE